MPDQFRMPDASGLLRGAEAIRVYLNRRLVGGKPLSRGAVYRLIEEGRLPITRFGPKGAEVWARQADLDDLFAGVDNGSETR
jgi:hypothetical protein